MAHKKPQIFLPEAEGGAEAGGLWVSPKSLWSQASDGLQFLGAAEEFHSD